MDTLQFIHHNIEPPEPTSQELVIQAANKLTDALLKPPKDTSIHNIGDDTIRAIHKLVEWFKATIPALQRDSGSSMRVEQRDDSHTSSLLRVNNTKDAHRYYPLRSRKRVSIQQINAIIDESTGKSLEYAQLIQNDDTKHRWIALFERELGHLSQGLQRSVQGTNTMTFILFQQIPYERENT